MMERSCTVVKAEDRRSLQKEEGRNVQRQFNGEIIHGHGRSYREVATILGSVVDPRQLHRRQTRFRETNNAEEGRKLQGVICGDTRKSVTGFLT
jgi:hypothetical protein